MRWADILIDLAEVVNASRSVASKHVALRARQLDRYSKSSTISPSLWIKPQWPNGGGGTLPYVRESSASQVPNGPFQEKLVRETPEEQQDAQPGGPVKPEPTVWQQESSFDRDQLPSLRVGGLKARVGTTEARSHSQPVSKTVFPHIAYAQQPAQTSDKSEFTPAPWARLGRGGPVHRKSAGDVDTARMENGDDRIPDEMDLSSAFRTARGAKLLDSLKIPQSNPEPAEAERVHDSIIQGVQFAFEVAQPRQEEVTRLDSPPGHSEGDRSSSLDKGRSTTNNVPEEPEVAPTPLASRDAQLAADPAGQHPSETTSYQLRESKVPATRLSRLWNYSGLAAGMVAGAIGEGFSRAVGGGGQGSMMLSAANMERLVSKLSRMRGAALKLGQMMSFQDSKMLPAPIQEVLQRVQDRADYMPSWQRDRVLASNLGTNWRELFDNFDEKPIAAASIGQVHRATLRSNGAEVAVKIQFPGVADSINSDLDNLAILLTATKLLPKGLYLNKTIDNARTELAWECDYEREAQCGQRYRELLSDDSDVFLVPKIYPELCGKQVLTMEYMEGVGVTRVKSFTQEQCDWIGTQILRLCLREITEFKFMQTDPNWTNFLYNARLNKLELLDFGASRDYPDRFISLYVRLLEAAACADREAVKVLSEELGYLTGHESRAMLDAHVTSVVTLAEPFLTSAPEVYDFRDQTITERVKAQIPVMIRERLAPPPEETYSLHRKLSGAFLLCARLGSRVRCRDLFEQALRKMDVASNQAERVYQ
ncbi:hypothetical protein VTK73DRAFT_8141 [Phialemonium thermophilum]|uniref:ABC1 atypical kinase-like domain-containing protein n=1 Tax=Phialemonium thermophilum TaxID=223376 RepID=A0ABR3XQT4_9PEZI